VGDVRLRVGCELDLARVVPSRRSWGRRTPTTSCPRAPAAAQPRRSADFSAVGWSSRATTWSGGSPRRRGAGTRRRRARGPLRAPPREFTRLGPRRSWLVSDVDRGRYAGSGYVPSSHQGRAQDAARAARDERGFTARSRRSARIIGDRCVPRPTNPAARSPRGSRGPQQALETHRAPRPHPTSRPRVPRERNYAVELRRAAPEKPVDEDYSPW